MLVDPLLIKVIGKAIMLASQSFAIGSVTQSSVYSVRNFSKDQDTLNNAADALRVYMIIGALWTASNMMVLGASYGIRGVVAAGAFNAIIMYWIWDIYVAAFKEAAQKYNLQEPRVLF